MAYDYKSKTIKSVYEEMNQDKSGVLTRAENCAKLTIPSVFPLDGLTDTSDLDDVYQSLGARAVLNLASKFMQTLMPSTSPFFKLLPSKELEEKILSGNDATMLDTLNSQLVKLETGIQHEMERQSIRKSLHEALKLNIVTGNALIWKDKDTTSVFSLRNYGVKRDSAGNILDLVVEEIVSPRTLPEDITISDDTVERVSIYTRMVNDGEGNYQIYQEVDDKIVSGSEQAIKLKDPVPFIVLRWTALPNSHYGRGLVEHYLGDLRNYEAINMVIVDIASIMAKTIQMVNPNSQYGTNIDDLKKAQSGDYIAGHADDITTPQTNKFSDLRALLDYMQGLELRLSQAFLLFTSRDAERVTAIEIKRLSQQLEETLGGVYTLLAEDVQRPLLALFMKEMKIKLDKSIQAVITTGLDALGRGVDFTKIMETIEGLNLIPNAWGEVKVDVLVRRLTDATGVPSDNLFFSAEEKQASAQAQQEQMLQNEAGMSVAKEGGKRVVEAGLPIPQ